MNLLLGMLAASGGCLSMAQAGANSHCVAQSAEARWLNPPVQIEIIDNPGHHYDRTLGDPAFARGAVVSGDARLELKAPGRNLVEIFLMAPEGSAFLLSANGRVVDDRLRAYPGPARLRPKRGLRGTSLFAIVDGPATLTIQTEAQRYVLSAVRWTPLEAFETLLVPKWMERARWLQEHPLFEGQEGGPFARRNYLEQLWDRIYLSSNPARRREALLGLTRAWFWLAFENHEPRDLARSAELFQKLLEESPQDPIVRQMISMSCILPRMPKGSFCEKAQPVPWQVSVPSPPSGAPEWAIGQRKLARRMEAVTRWWVEERQQPNGEIGGGWGDDVEILRNWGAQAMGLGSVIAAQGIKKMADGVWNSGRLLDGYDLQISDVEHASEPTTDTQPLLAALFADDSGVRERLAKTAACVWNWIARQPDGKWRFRGSWFNCAEFDSKPERAVDVHMNTRALGPALWHAYFTRDPKLIERIALWAESWVEAMRSTRHGKPAGIFPSAIRSPDGGYLIGSTRWDKPDVEWDYYQWSGNSQESMTALLLAVYDLTGDRRWLQAAGETFRVMEDCQAHARLCEEIRGAPGAFLDWRRLTGDSRYDRYFEYAANEQDEKGVLTSMARLARETERRLSHNFEMLTSEVLFTDRVYYQLPGVYRRHLFGGESPRGDRYPTFAVTWPSTGAEFARAVLEASVVSAKLRLYSFEAKPASVPVRLWRLAPGRYRWRSFDAEGKPLAGGSIELARSPGIIELPLPPRRELTVVIAKD